MRDWSEGKLENIILEALNGIKKLKKDCTTCMSGNKSNQYCGWY